MRERVVPGTFAMHMAACQNLWTPPVVAYPSLGGMLRFLLGCATGYATIALTICFRVCLLVLTVCFVSGVLKKKLLEGMCTHSTLRCV